jgi:hypothetical protein
VCSAESLTEQGYPGSGDQQVILSKEQIGGCFCLSPSYEGTGRSLSLKLIQQLRQQSAQSQVSTTAENKTTTTARLASGILGTLARPALHSRSLQTLLLGPCFLCGLMGSPKPSCCQTEMLSPRGELIFSEEQQSIDYQMRD